MKSPARTHLGGRSRYLRGASDRAPTPEGAQPSSEDLYRSLINGLPEIVFRKNAAGRYVFVNQRFCDWFGKPADEIVGRSDADLLPRALAEDLAADERVLTTVMGSTSEPAIRSYEFPSCTPPRVRVTRIPLYDARGVFAGFHGIVSLPDADAVRASQDQATNLRSERRRMEQLLARQAFYDPLTELPNRALFANRLEHLFRRAARQARRLLFGVLCVNVDRFKVINEGLGHDSGDAFLIQIARRLEGCLRPSDTLAHLGGDGFAILLEDLRSPVDATRVAERIHRQLEAPFTIKGAELYSSAATGISLSTSGYDRPEDMLRDADTAMNRAKGAGRSRHQVFEARMHQHAISQLRLETDLRHALERNEFVVHYQPIVDLVEGHRLLGFEALVRWQHPERGLIAPEGFVPAAEENGMIAPISLWVLEEASRQMRAWQKAYPSRDHMRIAVNLSSQHFGNEGLIGVIEAALRRSAMDPTALTIEITESALMRDVPLAMNVIARMRALGIELNIDDFGTGYSSLSYLQSFPVDALKIDRSFVAAMYGAGNRIEIVKAIVRLAHSLGMKVVAEGVETEEQLAALKEFRCNSAQGFLFGRRLPAREAERVIAQSLASPVGARG
jgi:diguanylate cyclase (GGDEF)-like protein